MADQADQGVPAGFKPAGFSPGFLDLAGPYFVKHGDGQPVIGCRIGPQHMNYVGVAHGGVLATLADVALSYQAFASQPGGLPVSTVSMATNFLSGAKLGDWIEASGQIDRMGSKLVYTSGSIRCGDRLLMTMSGVYAIFKPRAGAA